MRILIVALLVLSGVAQARELAATDQEQANLLAICDMASQSPSLNREVRAQVIGICLAWEKKIKDNNTEEKK